MSDGLNYSQKQDLLSKCHYADQLLSEIESILLSAQSNSVFPKSSGVFAPSICSSLRCWQAILNLDW